MPPTPTLPDQLPPQRRRALGDTGDADAAPWTLPRSITESPPPNRLAAAGVAALLVAALLIGDLPWTTAITLIALVPAVCVDAIVHRLPNRLVAGAAAIGASVAVVEAAVVGGITWTPLVLGALALAGPLVVMHLISPAAMGFGDVKFAVVLGAALGAITPETALVALAIAALAASAFGLVTGRRHLPFGPALLAGAIAVALVHSVAPLSDTTSGSPADVVPTESLHHQEPSR